MTQASTRFEEQKRRPCLESPRRSAMSSSLALLMHTAIDGLDGGSSAHKRVVATHQNNNNSGSMNEEDLVPSDYESITLGELHLHPDRFKTKRQVTLHSRRKVINQSNARIIPKLKLPNRDGGCSPRREVIGGTPLGGRMNRSWELREPGSKAAINSIHPPMNYARGLDPKRKLPTHIPQYLLAAKPQRQKYDGEKLANFCSSPGITHSNYSSSDDCNTASGCDEDPCPPGESINFTGGSPFQTFLVDEQYRISPVSQKLTPPKTRTELPRHRPSPVLRTASIEKEHHNKTPSPGEDIPRYIPLRSNSPRLVPLERDSKINKACTDPFSHTRNFFDGESITLRAAKVLTNEKCQIDSDEPCIRRAVSPLRLPLIVGGSAMPKRLQGNISSHHEATASGQITDYSALLHRNEKVRSSEYKGFSSDPSSTKVALPEIDSEFSSEGGNDARNLQGAPSRKQRTLILDKPRGEVGNQEKRSRDVSPSAALGRQTTGSQSELPRYKRMVHRVRRAFGRICTNSTKGAWEAPPATDDKLMTRSE